MPAPSDQSLAARVLAEASRHRGKPYRYGATGPSSFDCSGYVGYVYRQVGKPLPRTSREQYLATQPVARDQKQPGDLIFTRDASGRIYHVGIYSGGGKFWHSPRRGSHVKHSAIFSSNYVVGRVR